MDTTTGLLTMNEFWLVQRVMRGVRHEGPITRLEHLRFDYMGSAEFESGTIPKAYNAMQEHRLEQATVIVSAFDTRATLHVIAPAREINSLQQRLQAWFDGGFPGKENPFLEPVITRKGWRGEPLSDEGFKRLPIAWWALMEKIFFTTDESVSGVWLAAMRAHEANLPEGVR